MGDLHYTRDEVARLRDEATPGPWEPEGDSVVYNGTIPDKRLMSGEHDDGSGWLLADAVNICQGDADLIAAAPTLAADLLTLHDKAAVLRQRVEAMHRVLLALADGYATADHLGDVASSLMHGLGLRHADIDGDGWDFQRNLAAALRALAGEVPDADR